MKMMPFQISCPNGCVTHGMHSGPDHYHTLIPILGKDKEKGSTEIIVLKCPKCKFEAWATKEYRDKLGKPDQSYFDPETGTIKSDKLRNDEK